MIKLKFHLRKLLNDFFNTNVLIRKNTMYIATEMIVGKKTSHQLQVIIPSNFSTIKTIVSTSRKPICSTPFIFLLLLI